jgi:hypothetical protein
MYGFRVALVVLLASATCGMSLAADAKAVPAPAADPAAAGAPDQRITWTVGDKPTKEAAADLGKMVGFDIYVTKITNTRVTLDEKGVGVEAAISDLADAGGCSWMRAYLIEKQPGRIRYTAEQLLTILGRIQQTWCDSMTDDQWADYDSMVREVQLEMQADPFGPPVRMPGGGIARGQVGGKLTDDPIRELLPSLRLDKVTLHLKSASVQQMQIQLLTNSGFTCVVDNELTGKITESVESADLWPTLGDIATQVGGKIRPIYILAKPVVLTDEQVAARREQEMQAEWQDFWAKAPAGSAAGITSGSPQVAPPARASAAFTGNWSCVYNGTAIPGVLTQNGAQIDGYCIYPGGKRAPFRGTATGSSLTGTLSVDARTQWAINATLAGNTMQGTWGTGSGRGTAWSATRQ